METTNPNTEAVEGGFAQLTDFVTTTAAPALIGLAVVGIVIALGVKYLRKGKSAA